MKKFRSKFSWMKSYSKEYARVVGYLKDYREPFFISLVCMVIFGATDGALPFIVKGALDKVFSGKDSTYIYALPAAIIFLSIVRAVADFGQQYLIGKIGHSVVRDLRNRMVQRILELGPEYFLRNSSGEILSRVGNDVMLMRDLITNSVSAFLRDTIRIIALVCAAFYLDPTLALIAFVLFPIGVYPIVRFGKRMRYLSRKGQTAIGDMGAFINEVVLGAKIIKIFGAEKYEYEKFDTKNCALTKTFIKSEKIKALSGPVNEILASLVIAAILLYGGMSVINEKRTEGDFIAFLMAVLLMYDPFKKLSRLNNSIQQGMAGALRVFEIIDEKPLIVEPEKTVPLTTSSEIKFNGVTFSYPKSDLEALKEISLTVEEGQRVALVGFSGSGKSTLMDMIPRFIEPTLGSVTIGGVDVKSVSLTELRNRITMVTQHTFLFNDTIYNNILYGRRTASREEVMNAAEKAFATDFINNLSDGFETVVGESGLSLSGGERQRIAIARAILKDAPIVLLDEATASLDTKAERMVQNALEELEQEKTSLIIAHRLSTIKSADLIVVMEDGCVVERGTHDELLAKKGSYFKLYQMQFSKNEDTPDLEVENLTQDSVPSKKVRM